MLMISSSSDPAMAWHSIVSAAALTAASLAPSPARMDSIEGRLAVTSVYNLIMIRIRHEIKP